MGNKLISIILLFFVLELNCEAQFYKEWYASRTRKIDSLGKLELYKPPKVSKFTQNHGTINFTRDNLVEVYSGYYHFTMTDSIGNILFFTNGLRIYDRLGRVMPNGDSINLSVNRYNPNSNRYINTWQYLDTLIGANDYIYGCQAINYPGKPMHYLLIYSCIDPDSFSIDGILINLAEIDISGNNGYGSVIRKEETIKGKKY